jgi:hypothetical protein
MPDNIAEPAVAAVPLEAESSEAIADPDRRIGRGRRSTGGNVHRSPDHVQERRANSRRGRRGSSAEASTTAAEPATDPGAASAIVEAISGERPAVRGERLMRIVEKGGQLATSLTAQVSDKYSSARNSVSKGVIYAGHGLYDLHRKVPAAMSALMPELPADGTITKKDLHRSALAVVGVLGTICVARMTGVLPEGSDDATSAAIPADIPVADLPPHSPAGGLTAPVIEPSTQPEVPIAHLSLEDKGRGVAHRVMRFLAEDNDGLTDADRLLAPKLTESLLRHDPNLVGRDPTRLAMFTEFDVTHDIMSEARANVDAAYAAPTAVADVQPAAPPVPSELPPDAADVVRLQTGGIDNLVEVAEEAARRAGLTISGEDAFAVSLRIAESNGFPPEQFHRLADGLPIQLQQPYILEEWLDEILLDRQRGGAGN